MANSELELLHALVANDLLCNTSYPYKPDYFRVYRCETDIMADVDEISLYFHVPFCKSLCRFCEYTRFLLSDEAEEEVYLNHLERQIHEFFDSHSVNLLYGLDVGGGTPSVLSEKGLERLFNIISDYSLTFSKVADYESSIEFSYDTINEDKITLIGEAHFNRVSTGIQLYDWGMMNRYNRRMTDLEQIMMINHSFKRAGIKKINLDIMYGFPNQSDKMLEASIMAIGQLDVEQVTLYEMRYNQNRLKASNVTRKTLYDQYCWLYNALTEMGYKARFGQNTFSKNDKDEGVSSYLRYRMKQCVPYKGFGVSAQSMSMKGLSYNSLKGSSFSHLPKLERIEESYIYALPREEVVGKYVCVSLYNGGFDLDVVSRILGAEADAYYHEELYYLTDKRFIRIDNRRVNLTLEGFEYYAVVAAFFWSKSHRKKYLINNN